MVDKALAVGVCSTAFALFLSILACDGGFEGEEGDLRFNTQSSLGAPTESLAVETHLRFSTKVSEDRWEGADAGVRADTGVHDDAESGEASESAEHEDLPEVELTDVTSSDPSVLEIEELESLEDHQFQVLAKSSGEAQVDVEAVTPDGQTLTDGFELSVAQADKADLAHDCRASDESVSDPVYLTERRVDVGFDLLDGEGESLLGWGRYPVAIAQTSGDPELKTDTGEPQFGLPMDTGSESGETELQTELGDDSLTLDVRKPSVVDGIDVTRDEEGEPKVYQSLEDRDRAFLAVEYATDGRPVCQPNVELEATSQTKDVCTVEGGEDTVVVDSELDTSATCKVRISAPALADDLVTTVEFETGVDQVATEPEH